MKIRMLIAVRASVFALLDAGKALQDLGEALEARWGAWCERWGVDVEAIDERFYTAPSSERG